MYKYGSNDETDDILEFDATFDLTQDSALLNLNDDLYALGCVLNFVLILLKQVVFCDMESDSASNHDEDSKQRGPTTKAKSKFTKLVISYNKKGVPVGKEAPKLSTFEGLVARTVVPITYESSLEEKFVIDPKGRKQTLQSIGKKWRNFNIIYMPSSLRTEMQETDKTEQKIDRRMFWKKARELKTGGYESDVKMIVDRIDELQKSGTAWACMRDG
ncbi:unnamed protein product [Lactuca virosa]|uniref:Uncharacterized protein n=1 Tax=Lactuca virosa TaxID=75947 RepID=A0AAU9MLN5_9ASTR|nr:unnamed protein product [Lactuca virosa]